MVGLELVERKAKELTVKFPGDEGIKVYETLAEFPFDSTRKRMSLIVKEDNKYYLMTKGADSIMQPRINWGSLFFEMKHVEKDLYKFACEGLRTLVMGKKELTKSQYEDFEKQEHALKTSGDADKEKKLGELYDSYEYGLDFLGATAIEDKLQDGVPDAIAKVMEADIRVWVLTGDK